MSHVSTSKKLSYSILFLLLVVRIFISAVGPYLSKLSSGGGSHELVFVWLRFNQDFAGQLFWKGSFILLTIVLLINHSNLESMNIDKPFVFIFLSCGFLVSLTSLLVAVFTIPFIALNIQYLYSKKYIFRNPKKSVLIISLITIGLSILCLLLEYTYINLPQKLPAILAFPIFSLPLIVYEEVLYRGIFWMFLREFKIREINIVLIISFLFWISHIEYVSNSSWFWIQAPIVSIILGISAWRSRSITTSFVEHVIYDFIVILFSKSFIF